MNKNKTTCFFATMLLYGLFVPVFSQEVVVSGSVVDKTGEPLPGANIVEKGTANGTQTDFDGKFSISLANSNAILVVSYIGFITKEVPVGNRTDINVILEEKAERLGEVVVVGYGTLKKKDVTGAITQLNVEDISNEVTSNVQDILRSNIAGLNVGFAGDNPKGGGGFEVRGQTSLKASNRPLIVVDEIIYYGDITDINPSDIERVDLLKDASSAAVYGSRAANGVLLITTKKGTQEKPTIRIMSSIGFATPAHTTEKALRPEEFIQWRIDAHKSAQKRHLDKPGYYNSPDDLPESVTLDQWRGYTGAAAGDDISVWLGRIGFETREIENYKAGRTVDWFPASYHTGLLQNYNISLSSRKKDMSYYVSVGSTDNEGIRYGDRFKTIRSRLNLEAKVTTFLKVGTNTQFTNRDEGYVRASGNYRLNSPYASFYEDEDQDVPPIDEKLKEYATRITDQTGTGIATFPTGNGSSSRHPWKGLVYDSKDRKNTTQSLYSKLYAVILLPFNISFQSNLIHTLGWNSNFYHNSSLYPDSRHGGSSSRARTTAHRWFIDNILKWNYTFDNRHSFDLTLLQNAEKYKSWYERMRNQQYQPNDKLGYHRIQSGTKPSVESNDQVETASALMARLVYSYKSLYAVTGTWRRDGFSAFGQNNPFADFYSGAFAWTLSNESFFDVKAIDYLKLRLSYGTNGNRAIGRYDALSDLKSGKYIFADDANVPYWVTQLYVNRLSNPDIKWENTAAYNLGIDFGLLGHSISGSIEFYSMLTNDLLVDRKLPDITGFKSIATNLGQVQNRGLELTLNTQNIKQKNFYWQSAFSITLNRNKILSLYGDTDTDTGKELDDITNRWFIGRDIDEVWDYKITGVWRNEEKDQASKYGRQPGDFKAEDVNNDEVVTEKEDKQFLGTKNPKFRINLRNQFFIYTNFELSVAIYAYLGHINTYNSVRNRDGFYDRASNLKKPYWTTEGPHTDKYARIDSHTGYNYYQDRSFVRINNVALSYNVPKKYLSPLKISNCRLSFLVQNPFVWAPKWKYFDPEYSWVTPTNYTLTLSLTL